MSLKSTFISINVNLHPHHGSGFPVAATIVIFLEVSVNLLGHRPRFILPDAGNRCSNLIRDPMSRFVGSIQITAVDHLNPYSSGATGSTRTRNHGQLPTLLAGASWVLRSTSRRRPSVVCHLRRTVQESGRLLFTVVDVSLGGRQDLVVSLVLPVISGGYTPDGNPVMSTISDCLCSSTKILVTGTS